MLFQDNQLLTPHKCWQASYDTKLELPLFMSLVPAGSPSTVDGLIDRKLDLNELLITNRAATFYIRISGDSMIDANIYDGCYLVIDHSIEPKPGSIVLCSVDGDVTVKRWQRAGQLIVLLPANENYEPRYVQPGQRFEILGVVTWSINPLDR